MGIPMPGTASDLTTGLGIPTFTINIGQQWVGSVVGKNGAEMKGIETMTGAVVKLDHSSKAAGFSVCRVHGSPEQSQKACEMIRMKLIAAGAGAEEFGGQHLPAGIVIEDFPVGHGLVGLVMGRAGENLKQIRMESGAEVSFDKQSEIDGKDKFRIVGRKDNVQEAKRLIRERIAAQKLGYASPDFQPAPDSVLLEVRVEQQFIGKIIGKDRETLKQICDKTGVRIEIDQGNQDQGFSTALVYGSKQNAEAAQSMIMLRVRPHTSSSNTLKSGWKAGDWNCPSCGDQQFARKCRRCGTSKPLEDAETDGGTMAIYGCGGKGGAAPGGAPFGCSGGGAPFGCSGGSTAPLGAPVAASPEQLLTRPGDDAFPVEQKFVGFIIGPAGETLQRIQDNSGAKIVIDQATQDQGYSMIRIADVGSSEHAVAKDLIAAKIQESQHLPHMRLY